MEAGEEKGCKDMYKNKSWPLPSARVEFICGEKAITNTKEMSKLGREWELQGKKLPEHKKR